jgi:hypothetical protein
LHKSKTAFKKFTRNLQVLKKIFRPNHYTKAKMNRFRRGWAGAWAAVYFLTNTAAVYAVEKSLWEERRAALRRTASGARAAPVVFVPGASRLTVFDGGSTPSQPPSNFFKTAVAFDAASAALPFGSVSNMREGRRGAPVVFLVQDVHGNDGAQKTSAGC